MLSIYPACFFKEGNGYSVIFPDLNGLATCGDTLEEAMAMAVDCLAGYLKWCQEDGEDIPAPSPMSSISPEAVAATLEIDCGEAFVNLVSVDVTSYAKEHFNKSVKKTLTIPAWLNKIALEQGINFSQTLQEALLAKINATA
ncbi:MAG: type II toxin-antitoxin system HicB family antitoxin [Lachnospiraceae bacterium]|nr:type II toxin-antitoxin system HicB family antitoxin [Lachnospiraceae bacterium]